MGISNVQQGEDIKTIQWSETSYLGYYKNGQLIPFFNDTLLQKPLYIAQNQELVTTYTVNVVTGPADRGCENWATVIIKNYVPLKIPNAFSPNNDGLNDTWVIEGVARYPQTKLRIYNRWGSELYESGEGYQVQWDGTNNGSPLATGTYYYVIDFRGSYDNTDYSTSGVIVIVR